MIPALMVVFALGGTTYGMAEESLAFYALVITVLIAASYDAYAARSSCSAADRHPRLDDQPLRDGDRVRVRRRVDATASPAAS